MLFSFCYLYFLEGDLLAEAQFVFSHGLTTYSILVGSVTLTVVLQFVQWIISLLFKFSWQCYALSYFPSLLGLAILTDQSKDTIMHFSLGAWIWLGPLLLVLYVLLVCLIRNLHLGDAGGDIKPLLWRNYLILFVMLLGCGAVSPTKDVYCYELKTERLVMEKDYEGAARVADRSLAASRRLTELRMFALSKQDRLSECLFDYPQYYGAAGLLSIADTSSLYRFGPISICYSLGAIPDTNTIRSTRQYLMVMNRVDSLRTAATQDYYLCYLLLDKNLRAFTENLRKYYREDSNSCLPRAYREAVLYINNVYGKKNRPLDYAIDSETVQRFEQYRQRKAEIADERERFNLMRREFGNTFWWYYEFQKRQ